MKTRISRRIALLLSIIMMLTSPLSVCAQELEALSGNSIPASSLSGNGLPPESLSGNSIPAQESEEGDSPEDETETQSPLEKQVMMFSMTRSVPEDVIGSENNPFSIASEEALLDMSEKVSGRDEYEVNGETYQYSAAAYCLDGSITLSQASWSSITGIRSGFILDGQGYTISGLKDDCLLNLVPEGAVIRNLTVDGEIRDGYGYAILTLQNSGTIENCRVTGSIAGSAAAGLVSDNYGTITGCTSDVNIEVDNGAGGIAFYHREGIIENCVNTGDIHGVYVPADGNATPVGGIAAFAYAGISGCSNTGTVINEDGDYGHAAGIVGYLSDSTVSGCTNTGTITGTSNTGGIAGYSQYCTVTESSNAGEIIGSGNNSKGVGGVIGYLCDGDVTRCANTGSVTSGGTSDSAGGILGTASGDTGGGIAENWNSGDVSCRNAGGIVGHMGYFNDFWSLTDCYNQGDISGDAYPGGICGFISSGHGEIQNCYSTGRVSASYAGLINSGGICGNATSSSLAGCYALNESVTSSDGSATSVARIRGWDHNQLSGNYGWDQMLLNGQRAVGGTAENEDGADVTTEALTDPENTAGLWSNFSDDVWTKENGSLPILTNAVGEQSSQFPDYIINGPTEPDEAGLAGEGTEESPYLIETAQDWQFAVDKMNSYDSDAASYRSAWYSLENDLSLVMVTEPAAMNSSYTPFVGHFNGNNHTVQINLSGTYSVNGLFGYIGADGVAENLTVTGMVTTSRTSSSSVGMIAGNNAGTIRNCHVSGMLINSSNSQWNGGGIAGINSGTIENSSARADISGGRGYVGGIAGQNSRMIRNSYSQGSLSISTSSSSTYGGGIAGYQSGTSAEISGCYSGMRIAAYYGGGILGYQYGGSVHNCAAIGETVTGNRTAYIGRIAGRERTSGTSKSDNYGWTGMTDMDGTLLSSILAGTAGNKNGADLSETNIADPLFWTDLGFDPAVWKLEAGFLPVLAGTAADSTIPDYLQSDTQAAPELKGDGTAESPYEIGTAAELRYAMEKINSDPSWQTASFVLTADIDLSGIAWTAIGTVSAPFKGTFDGGNHRISNLSLVVNASYQGFFGVTEDAYIHNLILQGKVTGSDYAGGIVGYAAGETVIEACQSKVNVLAYPGTAAGIAGINEGTIRHCLQTGDIQGPEAAGGIAGNNGGTIEHCYSIGTLRGQNTGAGGIAVENSGIIRYCAAMEESITALAPGEIGGIVLSSTGTLENNYVWSEMKLEGTLVSSQETEEAEEASLYGKESAITIITRNKKLFPEDMWVFRSGFYPMLAGQTDMNYILPHQINNGREMISTIRISIPAPAVNQTPVTELAGDGWTATVAWSPAPEGTFGYSTVYAAVITLTLNSGYVLDDAAEFFVNGESAACEGSGPYLITAVFPATEEAPKPPEEETEQPETPPAEGGETEQPETPSGEESETEQPETPADEGENSEKPGGSSGGSGGDAGAAAPETKAAESQAASEQTAAAANGAETGDTAPIMLLTLMLLAAGTIVLAAVHKKQNRA